MGKKVWKKRLNDLTVKEWAAFQKSWFACASPPRNKTKLIHPAPFPEELAAEFIRFFTRKGMWVLDPMVGSGSTLIACALTERNGIGIELNTFWAEITRKRLEEVRRQQNSLGNERERTEQRVIIADAREIDKIEMPPIDYVITSPPYWNILRTEGRIKTLSKHQHKRQEKNLPLYYSEDPRDLGNIEDYDQFLTELTSIYRKVSEKMRDGAYMTVIVRNVKKKGKLYPLAWDLAIRLSEFLELRDEKIWCQTEKKITAVCGYPHTWFSIPMHHYCLILRKP
jgi:DNA modification methylase